MKRVHGLSGYMPSIRQAAAGLLAAVLGAATLGPDAQAQQAKESYIRDAEIEQLMRDYLNPILRAAGQPVNAVKLSLVSSRTFNAYVSNGRRMTVYMGALIETTTPNQLTGVLAHETGHISGGHLARLSQELPKAQAIAVLGTLLGAGAVVAGSRNSNVGMGGTGPMGAILAGPELAMRSLLAYQRTEEAAADRAAITFLNATKQSGKGMVETLKKFAEQQIFLANQVDKYLLSHPLAKERIVAIEEVAKASPYYDVKDSPAMQARHDLARAKIIAFSGRREEISRRYPLTDTSLAARYARAIAAHLYSRGTDAQAQIDGLIKSQPANPYFWELKGQNLLEAGQANAALAPLRKATQLAPGQPLLRVILGHALIGTGAKPNIEQAVKELTVAIQRDPEVLEAYVYLAQAYDKLGKTGEAELVIAESYFMAGGIEEARQIAKRAQGRFPEGSPGWKKADDLVTYKSQKQG